MIAMMLDDGGGGTKVPPAIAAPEPAPAPAPEPAPVNKAAAEHAEAAPAADAVKGAAEIVPEPAKPAPLPEAPRPEVKEAPAPAPAAAPAAVEAAAAAPAPEAAPQAEAPAAEAPKTDAPKGIEAKAEAPKGGLRAMVADASTHSDNLKVDEHGANKVEDAAKDARGDETSNDGKSDNLRSDSYDGAMDLKIAITKTQEARLAQQTKDDLKRADELKKSVDDKELQTEVASNVAKVVFAPVAFISGLFGADPIKDVTKALTGVDGEHERLDAKRQDVDKGEAELTSTREALQGQVAFNFLSDVAHVTGMSDSVSKVLDGNGGVDYTIKQSTGLDSDAAYDSDTRKIIVDSEVISDVSSNMKQLQSQGIVDEDGNILDAHRFDASKTGDSAISSAALLGVHEVTHAAQDSENKITQAAAEGAKIIAEHKDPEEGAKAAELNRIDKLEYDGYVNQETVELQAGKEKAGFVTINPDGSLLPREQAVVNIAAFQLGQPLVYGVSAGQGFSGVSSEAGGEAEGDTPGRRAPGDEAPGRRAPGNEAPGRRAPGDEAPGRRAPGDEAPGRRAPGNEAPGRRAPGRRAPGSITA